MQHKTFVEFIEEKGFLVNEGKKKKWIQKAVKHPGRCTPMPNPDCPKGSPQYNLGKRFKKHEFKKKGE